MPKNQIGDIPFPPLVKIDTNEPLRIEQVTNILKSHPKGVSICIRSKEGHPNRGGYFFHILSKNEALTQCEIYNFEKTFCNFVKARNNIALTVIVTKDTMKPRD